MYSNHTILRTTTLDLANRRTLSTSSFGVYLAPFAADNTFYFSRLEDLAGVRRDAEIVSYKYESRERKAHFIKVHQQSECLQSAPSGDRSADPPRNSC
jgi:hypothetical protein